MCDSTNYYRKNKKTKKVIHICPHCNYSTTGPKITLQHHILSKHTKECDRPFQCKHSNCDRGFAQKIHYQNHLCTVHGEKKESGRKKKVLFEQAIIDRMSKKTAMATYGTLSPIDNLTYNSFIKKFNDKSSNSSFMILMNLN